MNEFDMSVIVDGLILSVVGMTVVFLALIFLWFALTLISKLMNFNLKERLIRQGKPEEVAKAESAGMPGEVAAAISLALHMYIAETHDEEPAILTIKRQTGRYSPWSSKIYGVMGLNKKFYRKAS